MGEIRNTLDIEVGIFRLDDGQRGTGARFPLNHDGRPGNALAHD